MSVVVDLTRAGGHPSNGGSTRSGCDGGRRRGAVDAAEVDGVPGGLRARAGGRRRRLEEGVLPSVASSQTARQLFRGARFAELASPPPTGDVARKRLPEALALGNGIQELGVDRALVGIAEVPRIRMTDALDQAGPAL